MKTRGGGTSVQFTDIETLKKRAEKERTKAWRKGKVSHEDEEE